MSVQAPSHTGPMHRFPLPRLSSVLVEEGVPLDVAESLANVVCADRRCGEADGTCADSTDRSAEAMLAVLEDRDVLRNWGRLGGRRSDQRPGRGRRRALASGAGGGDDSR